MKLKFPHIAFPKFRLRGGVIALFWLAIIFMSMSFAHQKQSVRICNHVEINIDDSEGNFFIEDEDITVLITNNYKENVINETQQYIDLRRIESRVSDHGFVHKAQVYRDLKGSLYSDVTQEIPFTRLSLENGNDRYISKYGKILPLSNRFTARVMVLSGAYNNVLVQKNWENDSLRSPYLEFLTLIQNDKFLRQMCASAHINRAGEISIQPQIGRQVLEFGLPENLDTKTLMLKTFYRKIVPTKGWNTYSRVNMHFDNQIICE